MKEPLFSIIVPAYNVEKYIEECINSVHAQTYPYWEMIIINDGSNDRTDDVVEKFLDDTRIVLITKSNTGVADARNWGLSRMHGEYFLFLDADDLLHSNTLSYLQNVINEESPDFVYFGFKTLGAVREEKVPNVEKLYFSLTDWKHDSFMPVNIAGGVYRSALFHQAEIAFTKGITHAEDQEFLYKYLSVCSTIYTIPKAFYNYRIHDESASHCKRSFNYDMAKCHLIVASNLLHYLSDNHIELVPPLQIQINGFIKKYLVSLVDMPIQYRNVAQADFRLFYADCGVLSPSFSRNKLLKIAKYNISIYLFILRYYIKLRQVVWKK